MTYLCEPCFGNRKPRRSYVSLILKILPEAVVAPILIFVCLDIYAVAYLALAAVRSLIRKKKWKKRWVAHHGDSA
ncbi:MAG: hypothetical protein HYU64_14980 [Armatimonadetes bacterium]|nr:hypothetical protein [Armatimonadota bacterium]